jgi:FkbM family methyltransferase
MSILRLLDYRLLRSIFLGVAASTEHLRILKPLDVKFIVDIGANRGQFALIARYLFPKARIISFEPLDYLAPIFNRVFHDDKNVKLNTVAIGPMKKMQIFHVSARDDSSSVLPISKLQEENFSGTHEITTRTVHLDKLVSFIAPSEISDSAILKLDVQGYEFDALIGCLDLLHCFKWIYCECSFKQLYSGQKRVHEVIELLSNNNFDLIGIDNLIYDKDGSSIQADFLFLNKSVNY